ncbi:MAG: thymidylate synthase-like protein [Solirubrobacterales bacterium]|jgi:hypothetical protein|nr:thymidylate synthase-like protein [Solirubrobacterales bacterium]
MTDVGAETRINIPDGVVLRDFGGETVALNLSAGTYHGLNDTAARALELLQDGHDVARAAAALAAEFDAPADEVQQDVERLCRDLAARGLVEIA